MATWRLHSPETQRTDPLPSTQRLRARAYLTDTGEVQDLEPERISDLLEKPGTFVWLDIENPVEDDFALITDEFGLHDLAVEDATKPYQRPKLEFYDDHLFMVVHPMWAQDDQIARSEIDMFVGPRFLVTVRKDPVRSIEEARVRWESSPEMLKEGVGYIIYVLLDSIVDEYFVVADDLTERIEDLEDEVISPGKGSAVPELIFRLRKELVTVRRAVFPMREVMNALSRRDSRLVSPDLEPYFQDIYDHVLRVSESIENQQELLSAALEIYLSAVSNNLNAIMKRVTSWAAIIGVATAIAGIYGMNFELVPRSGGIFGFWFAIGLILLSTIGLYIYFKARDWL
ncbi:MAG TPA: magnesium/cobalt transporter CorA [Actinomycetota bacterium]|nr:magnesium/cobalt transporter CorA [Actinomycetota bacterium]